MDCCNEYGHCTGGHNCPARATPLVDASRKALAVLALTGADPALQDEMVGAIAESDRRIAEMTAQRDALQARLDVLLSEEKSMVEKTGYLSADVLADNYLLVVRESKAERDELIGALARLLNAEHDEYLTPLGVKNFARSVIAKHQPTAAPAANTP